MNVKGDVSTNWKMFKEAWCYYVTSTELNKKPKEVQAGALCSVMGMNCVKLMNSLTSLTTRNRDFLESIGFSFQSDLSASSLSLSYVGNLITEYFECLTPQSVKPDRRGKLFI